MTELSRQRKWQLARINKGLCWKCGKKRKNYSELCDEHAKLRAESRGQKTWTKGSRGRPPKGKRA